MWTGWVFPGHLQPAHEDGALCVLCGYSEDVNYVTGLAPCMSSQAQPQKKDEYRQEVLVSSELRENILVSPRNITSVSSEAFPLQALQRCQCSE